jgi:Arc/MetJ-type ribon-helix-helix transcriptional regulator
MTPELQTKGGVASAAAMRSGLADPVPVGEGAVKGWRVEKRMPAPAHPAAHAFPVSVKGVAVQGGGVLLLENERNEWELPGGKLELREERRMTRLKIAITLPEEQVAAARQAVAEGRAASVSAFISQALARRDADEEMAETIAEIYAESGQPTEEDRLWARRVLGIEP